MLNPDEIAEINLLTQFNLSNSLEGLKVHQHDASEQTIAACQRLHAKGLISLPDGGYLTSLGHEAVEHAQALLTILRTL